MCVFDWNDEKNQFLKTERGVTFEDIVFHITHGGLPDVIEHPKKELYSGQKIFIVNVEEYIYIVPFVENDETVFLKTIRKMTKLYLKGGKK